VVLRVSSWPSLPCKVLSRPIFSYLSSSLSEGGNNNNVDGGKSEFCGIGKGEMPCIKQSFRMFGF
jgi:hypothetical protein